MAYEEGYRAYRGAIAEALRALRPRHELAVAGVGRLGEEVGWFDPHLVVSSRPNTVDPGGRAAWVTLPEEPDDPSEICLDGGRSASENPGFRELLAIVDEAEELLRGDRELGGC